MKGYDPFTPDAGFDAEPVFDAPPPRPRGANIEGMRKALMRSNTRLLLSAVMLFQFTAMLLISLQEKPVDTQALILAVALPAVTWLVVMAFGRLWPIDRAILILALLLCSVGIITLSDIAAHAGHLRPHRHRGHGRGHRLYPLGAPLEEVDPAGHGALPVRAGLALGLRQRAERRAQLDHHHPQPPHHSALGVH